MEEIRNCCIRFNLNKPKHRKAWEHLQNIDRNKYKSYSDAVISFILEHFEEGDELIIKLRKVIREELSGINLTVNNGTDSITNEDDIDWEFLGE